MELKIAPTGSFFHKRHQRFTQGRLRTEILTLEEALWLFIGLAFGWFAAKTTSMWILIIPIGLLLVWIYEQLYAKKYGFRTIHGRRAA